VLSRGMTLRRSYDWKTLEKVWAEDGLRIGIVSAWNSVTRTIARLMSTSFLPSQKTGMRTKTILSELG